MRIPIFSIVLICLFSFGCGNSTSKTKDNAATESKVLLSELISLEKQTEDLNNKVLSFRDRLTQLRPRINESNVIEKNPAYDKKMDDFIALGKSLNKSATEFSTLMSAKRVELLNLQENVSDDFKINCQTFIDSNKDVLNGLFEKHKEMMAMEKEINGMVEAALNK